VIGGQHGFAMLVASLQALAHDRALLKRRRVKDGFANKKIILKDTCWDRDTGRGHVFESRRRHQFSTMKEATHYSRFLSCSTQLQDSVFGTN
jgi:hypothetical protein